MGDCKPDLYIISINRNAECKIECPIKYMEFKEAFIRTEYYKEQEPKTYKKIQLHFEKLYYRKMNAINYHINANICIRPLGDIIKSYI